jgi:UDP-N-acetylglucosamine 2-epimerase (non-hydrolysing)
VKPKRPLHILVVFGTRPEAVKMGPVVRTFMHTPGIHTDVLVTAQHREMLDQVLRSFEIKPQYDLDLMRPDQSLASLTAAVFTNLDPVLAQIRPDWVLVQGDTTTVMAAALCAYYRQIKVGHVEAGLRTFDKWAPFPEEINRQVASRVTDLHFAPTELNRQNLLREGIPSEHIVITGNPVIDALQWISKQPEPEEVTHLLKHHQIGEYGSNRLILVTAHRRENFGQPLEQICTAIDHLADQYEGKVRFIYPVHLNPHVQEPVHRMLGKNSNITLLPPMDYLPLVHLMKHATLVLTDSGGLQEEAPGLGKPVLVLRDVTERPEGVETGVLRLVGTDTDLIEQQTRLLLDDPLEYQKMARAVNPFGDGHAAERIRDAILADTKQNGNRNAG